MFNRGLKTLNLKFLPFYLFLFSNYFLISPALYIHPSTNGLVEALQNRTDFTPESVQARSLVVVVNGTSYNLDTKHCTGGVVFRKPVKPDQICLEGAFKIRISFCNPWNSIDFGSPTEYKCRDLPSAIQSLHPNFGYIPPPTTPTTTANPLIIAGVPPARIQHVVSFTPTFTPMFQASLWDEDLNPNITSSQEELGKHNNLLKKRQTNGASDFASEEDDEKSAPNLPPTETFTQTAGKPAQPPKSTTKKPDVSPPAKPPVSQVAAKSPQTPVAPPPEDDYEDEDNGESGGGEKTGESSGDLLPPDDSNVAEQVPGLLAVGDKIVNPNLQEDTNKMSPVETDGSILASSENDDLGEWENLNDVLAQVEYHPLPPKDTLEYDVVTGGMDRWFVTPSSPIFDAHITVLKAQISQSLGLAPLTIERTDQHPLSSVLESVQPRSTTWYKLLEKAVLVADHLIPRSLLPDRRPASDGESSQGFRVQFFYHALHMFGYFARTLQDEDVTVGLDDNEEFWAIVLAGMSKCVAIASEEGRQKKFLVSKRKNVSNCEKISELELSKVLSFRWSDYNRNFSLYNYSINYTHSLDPNYYLPPHSARINSRLWIFAEVLWYSVQLSYAYCFVPMSETNPDTFMMAYAKLIKIFESDLVQNLWNPSESKPGGNLDVYENFLPFIQHSAHGDSSTMPNSEDFERTLVNLDKISFVVHEESLLNNWIQRPLKKGGGHREEENREKRYWNEAYKRRRKRALDDDNVQISLPLGAYPEPPTTLLEYERNSEDSETTGNSQIFNKGLTDDVQNSKEQEIEVNRGRNLDSLETQGGKVEQTQTTDLLDLEKNLEKAKQLEDVDMINNLEQSTDPLKVTETSSSTLEQGSEKHKIEVRSTKAPSVIVDKSNGSASFQFDASSETIILGPTIETKTLRTTDPTKSLNSENQMDHSTTTSAPESTTSLQQAPEKVTSILSNNRMEDFGSTPALWSYETTTEQRMSSNDDVQTTLLPSATLSPSIQPTEKVTLAAATTTTEVAYPPEEAITVAEETTPLSTFTFATIPHSKNTAEETERTQTIQTTSSSLDNSLLEPGQRSKRNLNDYEIWDGLAYCLILNGNDKDLNRLNTEPSLEQLGEIGMCST